MDSACHCGEYMLKYKVLAQIPEHGVISRIIEFCPRCSTAATLGQFLKDIFYNATRAK